MATGMHAMACMHSSPANSSEKEILVEKKAPGHNSVHMISDGKPNVTKKVATLRSDTRVLKTSRNLSEAIMFILTHDVRQRHDCGKKGSGVPRVIQQARGCD